MRRPPHPKEQETVRSMTNLDQFRSVYRVRKEEGLQKVEGANDGISRPSTALKGEGLPDRTA